ncbi:NfeD family protein [Plantactinospora sp. GCM10030261]|uniref:NfeD family protein n=1 Tax=Plantactinospora sp. GCM10030261 TaxID=3273420 RepID=UPI00361AF17C
MGALIWIVLGAALAIAEIFTTTLFLIMFSVGAFAAAGAAALGAPFAVQAIVFALVSAVTVLGVRPSLRRQSDSAAGDEGPFGMTAITDETAIVLDRVDANGGRVKIGGELWGARAFDATQSYEPGEQVRVIEIKGVTAMVWRDDLSTSGELPGLER